MRCHSSVAYFTHIFDNLDTQKLQYVQLHLRSYRGVIEELWEVQLSLNDLDFLAIFFKCPQMCVVTGSQVVFINWQEESAFHAMQRNPLLHFHLSFSCYLLKHVQRALLTSDVVSQQVHFPTVKLSTPTGNKLQPTPLNAAIKTSLMA